MNEFGFTNKDEDYELVNNWFNAAVNDGWDAQPTYPGHETVDVAAKLTKERFVASILRRKRTGKWKFEANVHLWGPDGLAITPPKEYNWEEIKKSLRVCHNCHKEDVDTVRYSFAGRCCKECLSEMQRIHEYPGWCD
jgi:hypothetical protein